MKRRLPPAPVSDDIFGAWVPILALTASKTQGIEPAKRAALLERVERAYADMATAENPGAASWRDLADGVNFLQSLVELGWGQDPDGAIEDAKAALFEAWEHHGKHGKLRLSGPGLVALRNCADQLTEITAQLSAHSYWVAVAHTKRRVQKVLRGARQRGDVVVTI